MEDKICLIAGLPEAGKTTYIAALWAIEKDGNTNHALSCCAYPKDTKYLDELKTKWLSVEKVARTLSDMPQNIELELKSLNNENTLKLVIPDFKGEAFRNILSNNCSTELKNWCTKSSSIFFFINGLKPEFMQEEIDDYTKETINDSSISIPSMKPENISLIVQNILVLKYLNESIGDCKLVVGISAWDENQDSTISAENWLKKNHPLLYNFVDNHFSNVRYYGISAQGAEYTESVKDELVEKTEAKKRAYVYSKDISYDITEPLEYLIS